MIEVLEPGFLTTVQDMGRPNLGHLGIPVGGAADPWSLAVANLLAGNGPGAAALEISAAGVRLRAREDIRVALAGADLGAVADGRGVASGSAFALEAGQELELPRLPVMGVRAYVAVGGGFDVPVVLGSRSTCLAGAFGGVDGRPLRPGDVLAVGPASHEAVADAWLGDPIATPRLDAEGAILLRYLPAPGEAGHLAGRTWTVSTSSDRTGVRLSAPGDSGGELAAVHSHGVVRGTIQLPPDGRPIVLGPDHQTTGGYPVAGVVISADLAVTGQLPSGQRVRLEPVSIDAARTVLAAQRRAWQQAVRSCAEDAAWLELWRSAGA